MGCAARSRQGSAEWVSEQRAHSIGLAAAAVLVAPLVRVLSSAISSSSRRRGGHFQQTTRPYNVTEEGTADEVRVHYSGDIVP